MSDTAIIYSGATGLPAALKDAYFTLYSSPVGNYIYKYHLMALEGTLEIPNNTTDIGSQLGQSLLTYIPYVDTLDFSDCTYLTGVLNLSGMSNLRVLNASGTNLSADFGTGSGVTAISLGNPTSIVLKNPVGINTNNITVSSYSNITSVDIRNIKTTSNNVNTYAVFDKIFKNIIMGGTITFGSFYYGGNNWQLRELTGDDATKCWHTSDIELPDDVTTVTLQTSTPTRMVLFNKSDHSYVSDVSGSSGPL